MRRKIKTEAQNADDAPAAIAVGTRPPGRGPRPIGRARFWGLALPAFALALAAWIGLAQYGQILRAQAAWGPAAWFALLALASLMLALSGGLARRRLLDAGRSGAWLWIALTGLGLFFLIRWWLQPRADPEKNRADEEAPPPVDCPEALRLGLMGYADFQGRASRAEFWWWWLFALVLLPSVLLFLWTYVPALHRMIPPGWVWLAFLPPTLAVTARRLRDAGQPPLWGLAGLTIIALPWILFWALRPSVAPPPKLRREGETYEEPEDVGHFLRLRGEERWSDAFSVALLTALAGPLLAWLLYAYIGWLDSWLGAALWWSLLVGYLGQVLFSACALVRALRSNPPGAARRGPGGE